jgi:hypothetical protein
MPTEAVVKQYDELVSTIQSLIDVKRQTDKLESEIRSLRLPSDSSTTKPPATPSASAAATAAQSSTPQTSGPSAGARRRSLAAAADSQTVDQSVTKKRSQSPAIAAADTKRPRND